MNTLHELAIIFGLTLLHGVFAGSETAMLVVRKTRLRQLAEEGKRGAKVALRLRGDTERLLATIQVGITVVAVSTAVYAGARLEAPLRGLLERLGLARYAEAGAAIAVVALVSYLGLVFGALVPRSIALRHGERLALLVARVLAVVSRLLAPLVWILTKSSNVVLWPLRDRTHFAEARLSADELRQLTEEAAVSKTLHPEVSQIVTRALDLGELAVHAVMIPRTRMVTLPPTGRRGALLRMMRAQRHARYVVTVQSDDDVAGYVVARDLLERMAIYPDVDEFDLLSLARELPTFREQTPAIDALRRLQQGRAPFGLVIDEHGSVAGLVTIEDLAEEVLGEILDEDEVTLPALEREPDNSVRVRGDMPLQELGRELDLDVEPRPGATTVAGLLIQNAGRIPKVGERLPLVPGIEAEVLEGSVRQVRTVRLHFPKPQPPTVSEAPPG